MKPIPFVVPPDELAAYRLAAIGVLAHARGVRIERLELGEPARVQLQPLGQFCQPLKVVDDRERYCVENYLSVLIAGNLGIKIRMERELGMIGPNNPLARRKVAFRKLNPLPELEEAYALAFAWLKDVDGGNPERTIERVYHLTGKFLRADRQVRQLEPLAIALLQRKSLGGEEIKQVLMRVNSK